MMKPIIYTIWDDEGKKNNLPITTWIVVVKGLILLLKSRADTVEPGFKTRYISAIALCLSTTFRNP